MAELSDFMQPQANPFGGLAQGIQSGAQWAMQKAHLDVQAQQVQLQQQQQDEIKREFNAKMGQQMYEDYKDILPMGNGPLKNQLAQRFQDHWTQAGFPVDETWIAGLKDTDASDRLSKAMSLTDKEMGLVTDPDIYKQLLGAIPGGMGQKLALNKVEEMPSMIRSMRMMQQLGLQQDRLKYTEQKTGAQQYSQITEGANGLRSVLNGASRATSLIENIENPKTSPEDKIKSTKQLRSILANEEARLVTGKANFGEGTAADMQVDSFGTRSRDFWAKIKDEPEDTMKPEYLRQAKALYKDLIQEGMQAHDRSVDMLTAPGSGPDAQLDAVKSRANAFRSGYKKRFGYWTGDKAQQNDSAPAATSDDSGAQTKPANQVDPAAAQMAALIKRVKDPKKKAKFILQFKAKYGDDIATKTGVQ